MSEGEIDQASGFAPSQCMACRRRDPDSPVACEAFPGGIPARIRLNMHDHREEWPGDGGLRFAPRDDVPEPTLRAIAGSIARAPRPVVKPGPWPVRKARQEPKP